MIILARELAMPAVKLKLWLCAAMCSVSINFLSKYKKTVHKGVCVSCSAVT